jgi:hypothetical protein
MLFILSVTNFYDLVTVGTTITLFNSDPRKYEHFWSDTYVHPNTTMHQNMTKATWFGYVFDKENDTQPIHPEYGHHRFMGLKEPRF